MAYERKQYFVATDMLSKQFAKSKSRVERGQLAFLLGRSWTAMGESEKAIEWYKKAYDNAYGEEALIQQAFALKMNEQYEEAAEAFKAVGLETGDPITFRKEVSACIIAAEWKNTSNAERSFDIESSIINTSASEYAPVFYNTDLVFTSDRDDADGDATYNWTGRAFSDIFVKEDNSIKAIDGPFNTKHNDGTISYNSDLNYAVFTRCFTPTSEDQFCQLLESRLENGNWTVPQLLPFLEDGVNYGQPSVSESGDVIYFSSNHPDGWGGMDIYRVSKDGEEWNDPVILPLRLNTIEDEQFPFARKDTLYFASSGHGGMGGLDIYKTYVRSNGEWAPVENLKYPINSGGDDFGFIIRSTRQSGKLSEGYFSSNRKDGKGGDDIYSFTEKVAIIPEPEVVVAEKPEEEVIIEEVESTEKKYKLLGYVTTDLYTDTNDPKTKIPKSVTPVAMAKVTINYSGQPIIVTTDSKGYFEQMIDTDGLYKISASADGYFNNTVDRNITFKENTGASEQLFKVQIKLDRIFKNVEINLDNIYYDLDKANIREDAKPTLLDLAAVLKENPQIRIQLSSHTDCRGPVTYNQNLSQRRAQSAVDYLISQGISPDRLQAKGYGASRPADICVCNECSEDQHQANRRTTFKIIE